MNRTRLAIALMSSTFPMLACSEEPALVLSTASLEVSPSAVDLGDVAVGGRQSEVLTLHNDGSIALSLSAELDESLGTEFELEDVPESLAPGQKKTARIAFAPTSSGPRSGAIRFHTSSKQNAVVEVTVTGRGVDPALVANPPAIDFGRVLVGTTATASVVLTNTSDREVTVLAARIDDPSTTEFATTLARTALAPGESMPLEVRYLPTSAGNDETRIVIDDSSPRTTSLSIRARGEGVDSDIVIEPLALTFSAIHVGQSRALSFFIQNIGTRAHSVDGIAFESSGAMTRPEFAIGGATLPAVPFAVAPGERVTVDVTYAPTDVVMDTDRIRVESSGLREAAFVSIGASADPAPAPHIEVTPTTLAFGNVEIGQTATLNLEIANAGTADLTIASALSVQPASSPYTLDGAPDAGHVLRPLDREIFRVAFRPTTVGAAPSADVVIASNDPATSVVRIALSGAGVQSAVPKLVVDPNPIDFGGVPRGIRTSRPIRVRNDGSAPLTLTLVRLANDAGGRFTLAGTPAVGATLNPSGELTFSVEYSDNGVVATHNGTLEFQSNDPSGTVRVPVSASTEPPPPALTDIAITLRWSLANTDVDVHLVRPGGTFFDAPSDCCYCNGNPDWGTTGQSQDNPFLDRDDLVGPGPEKINLGHAENGEYEVLVHYFDDHGNGSSEATVEVSMRGTVVATKTETLSKGERWSVGKITWNASAQTGQWRDSILGTPRATLFSICR